MSSYYPKVNQNYTISQIYNELRLRDGPHLSSRITNPLGEVVNVVVQDTVCSVNDIINSFADKSFKYLYETSEWIPVFEFVGTEQEFLACVETAVELDTYFEEGKAVSMMVWPKNTTYEQFYKLSEDGNSISNNYETYPLHPRIKEALFKHKNT